MRFLFGFLGICSFLMIQAQSGLNYEIARWKGDRAAAVSLTFDDNFSSHFTDVVPYLNSKGIKGTFFVISNTANANDVQFASQNGHEIGNHGVSDKNWVSRLSSGSMTVEQIKAEMESSAAWIETQTGLPCQVIAWPQGGGGGSSSMNKTVRDLAIELFPVGARNADAADPSNVKNNYHPYEQYANDWYDNYFYQIKSITTLKNNEFYGSVIENLIEDKAWFVQMYHQIGDADGYDKLSLAKFQEQINIIQEKSNSLWVAPFGTINKYHQQYLAQPELELISENSSSIILHFSDSLSRNDVFNEPMTIKLEQLNHKVLSVTQNGSNVHFERKGIYVYFDAVPDGGEIVVTRETTAASNVSGNAIKHYYQENYPVWTDEIKWDNRLDMSVYANGSNDFEKFENARDELHVQGGGVLYYPAGTYDFSDVHLNDPDGRGLMLKTGVVILGEEPTGDNVAYDGEMALATIFKFPFETKTGTTGFGEVPYAWNIIGITPSNDETLKDVNNVGVAWVQIDGAAIYFGLEANWGATLGTSGAWYSGRSKTGIWKDRVPDGTHPLDVFAGYNGSSNRYIGAGKNRFVFGCELKNSTVHNPKVVDLSQGGAFDYYMYKFGSRIGIYGSNVLVANNLLSKSNKNFLYNHTTAITQQDKCNQVFGTRESVLLYDYGKTFGIDINKTFLNVFPNKNDGYFLENIVVRDNYIYSHGGKGTDISGTWVEVTNNHNERDYLQEGDNVYGLAGSEEYELTLDGWFESVLGGNGCLSDNQSRAFDMAGQALWLDGNSWNNLGSNPGNDGESILCQRHGGTDIHSWALTRNKYTESYNTSNKGYLSGYDVHNQGMLVVWNDTESTVGNLKAGNLYDCSFIPSESEEFFRDYVPSTNDVINKCTEGELTAPAVEILWPEDSSYIEIIWADNSDQEIGFRVDRREKESEEWSTIVYRPRQSQGHQRNEPKWRDYNAPLSKQYEYRVVAINCNDDESGASEWISSIEPEFLEAPELKSSFGDIYVDSVEVNIIASNINAEIYYTLDGSEPTRSSSLYEGPFYLKEGAEVNSIVFKGDLEPSERVTMVIDQLDPPSISSCENELSEFFDPLSVTIISQEEATEIKYSLSNPNIGQTDFTYRQAIPVSTDSELYARAFGPNILPSVVAQCSFRVTVRLSTLTGQGISVYPNPVMGSLNLKVSNQGYDKAQIQIYDLNGAQLLNQSLDMTEATQEVNVSSIDPGIYLMKVLAENTTLLSEKIVIK